MSEPGIWPKASFCNSIWNCWKRHSFVEQMRLPIFESSKIDRFASSELDFRPLGLWEVLHLQTRLNNCHPKACRIELEMACLRGIWISIVLILHANSHQGSDYITRTYETKWVFQLPIPVLPKSVQWYASAHFENIWICCSWSQNDFFLVWTRKEFTVDGIDQNAFVYIRLFSKQCLFWVVFQHILQISHEKLALYGVLFYSNNITHTQTHNDNMKKQQFERIELIELYAIVFPPSSTWKSTQQNRKWKTKI